MNVTGVLHSDKCAVTKINEEVEFVSGAMAAVVNIVITFPLNKIMFRQMVHGVKTPAAITQIKNEGMATLFKGCLPPLLQKTIATSIMFGTYASYQRQLRTHLPQIDSSWHKHIAALLAGSSEAILCPLERAQCLLQDVDHMRKFKNTAHVFSEMRTHGLSEYYRGLSAVLLRNGPSTLMFFSLRDIVRQAIPIGVDAREYQQILADFVSGSVVGAIVSTVFYPVNVVKIRMQVEYGTPHLSMWKAFQLGLDSRDRSLRKMFYGVHLNYSRALLSWGITNAAYEIFKKRYNAHLYVCDCEYGIGET